MDRRGFLNSAAFGPAAAIAALKARTAIYRVYQETSALKLLGFEDKLTRRLDWKEARGRPIGDDERKSLDGIREEIKRRSQTEMDDARYEFKRRNKIESYFPDEGPFRRELYPKHMKVIEYTRTDEEILMMAANRCISPWTPVEMASSTRQCVELIGAGAFDVRSWDGSSRCSKPASPVFLKGIEPMWRLHLDNGSTFDVSRKHRVLIAEGSAGRHLSDWVSIGQLIHAASGLHCWQTREDSMASYVVGGRPCGELPLSLSGIGRESLPLKGGAQRLSMLSASLGDGVAHKSLRSRVFQGFGHSPNWDDPSQIAALCARFEDPSSDIDDRWPTYLRRELQLLGREYGQRRQVRSSAPRQPSRVGPLELQGSCDTEETSAPLSTEGLGGSLFAAWYSPLTAKREFLEAEPHTAMFFPFDIPPLVGGQRIVALTGIGPQPVLDFEVSSTHCYESGGAIHHNCGKTDLGGYCVSTWATGRYPYWWHGRVFDEPITAWVCNKTAKDCRDINEAVLLGPPGNEAERGTGMIPGHLIQKCTPKSGTPNAFEFIQVEHVSGQSSYIVTKSYDQGREAFQGRGLPIIWDDEEVTKPIADEQKLRVMTLSGLILYTFTPIQGLTEFTADFMESAGLSIEAMRHGEEVAL